MQDELRRLPWTTMSDLERIAMNFQYAKDNLGTDWASAWLVRDDNRLTHPSIAFILKPIRTLNCCESCDSKQDYWLHPWVTFRFDQNIQEAWFHVGHMSYPVKGDLIKQCQELLQQGYTTTNVVTCDYAVDTFVVANEMPTCYYLWVRYWKKVVPVMAVIVLLLLVLIRIVK